jgi:ABC-type nickel/cobalt efflux system permease component RcnA
MQADNSAAMPHRAAQFSDILAMLTLFGAVTVQQEHLEWGVRIIAGLVAIMVGIVTLWQKLRPGARRRKTDTH